MLTDALSNGGMEIPKLESPELLSKLYPGSSVANPIDFLATGTAEQLGEIIEHCDKKFDQIDGMAVIFGSPGLFEVYDVYRLLDEKMKSCKKPIFPVLPSIINAKKEIEYFLSLGRMNFPDEVVFGNALCKVFNAPQPELESIELYPVDKAAIRSVINESEEGYIHPEKVQALLDAAGITRAGEAVVATKEEAIQAANHLGLPVVMKVVGPVHKSDVGGVSLNVKDFDMVASEFNRMIRIPDTTAILIQPMISGLSVFAGANFEPKFGHMILCGLGGIYIEVLKDVQSALSPVSSREAERMIRNLKSYPIIQGVRGQTGINEALYAEVIRRISALCEAAPEIMEMDINPLIGTMTQLVAVDARVRISK